MKAKDEQEADAGREQRLERLLMPVLCQIAKQPLYALEAASVLRVVRHDVADVYERAATASLIAYPELGGGRRPELTGSGRTLLAASH
jgi:hypothetical protein